MTIKIKNFCFVGIAAAMLSATAANATPTPSVRTEGSANVVTSQKYTNATFAYEGDKIATTTGLTEDDWDSTAKYPSMNVLKETADAITSSATNMAGDTNYIEVSNIAASGNTPAHQQVGIITTNLVTDSTGVANTQNNNKLTTASAVRTYADSKVNETSTLNSSSTTTAPNEQLVSNQLALKQNIQIGATIADSVGDVSDDAGKVLVVDNNGQISMSTATGLDTYQTKSTTAHQISDGQGGWQDISNGIVNGTYVTQTADATNHTTTLDVSAATNAAGIAAAASSSSTTLATDYAVKDYAVKIAQGSGNANKTLVTDASGNVIVSSVTSSPLPAMPDTCTDAAPCALVADTTGGIHWVAMAQPSANP